MKMTKLYELILLRFYVGIEGQRIMNQVENDYDVYSYFRRYENTIPHCDQNMQLKQRKKTGGTCIYISPRGHIIHARDLHNESGSGKQMLMDMMIRGVLKEMVREKIKLFTQSNWISFFMVYTASGPIRDENFPMLAFGKRYPNTQPGLLIPNPFFVTPRWWDDNVASMLQKSVSRPWHERSPKALFRGACGPGAHARFELLRLRDPQNLLDVGFTKVDGYSNVKECVSDLAFQLNGTKDDIEFILNHRIKAHVPQTNFSYYRYLLHMPGSATGSYSRNLQYLWSHGSVVLIWKNTASEWYYQHLRDGVHYVSVDVTNIYPLLQSLDADPYLQLRLRRGSTSFASTYLSGRSLT
uniref:Glycosyl transferase CAP10 domain-containing protein n=2 Tax=Aureoumbra lagunensis TaxID=44058 RepID=A0A7S3NLK9_9STRA